MGLCQSEARIDLAAINGHLDGYEIKTTADTLARLPRQERVYSRIFDRLWLVADERHLDGAMELLPDWWGVLRVDTSANEMRLREVRRARVNREVELDSLVRLLWREEAFSLLEALDMTAGLKRAPRREIWAALAGAVPEAMSSRDLRRAVRERLKNREGWRVAGRRG